VAGLPGWLAQDAERAAAELAAIVDGLAAVAEFEADDGALTDAERTEARQALIDAGVTPPQRVASWSPATPMTFSSSRPACTAS
ncbi:MAG: hypothetical protein ACRDSM_12040, partial [Pseudonocardiaceae bacterium]